MRLLVLDNYDSFTYNLVHIIRALGYTVEVFRNDKITLEEVGEYDKIVLSPGPGIPDEAGIMKDVIKRYGASKSILGVCLGHQGIAEVYGAELYNLSAVKHGISGNVEILNGGDYLFKDVPSVFKGCHYHSWVIDQGSINGQLEVTARDEEGNIMAIAHKEYDVRGVQFHPESILTEHGIKIIENWLKHNAYHEANTESTDRA